MYLAQNAQPTHFEEKGLDPADGNVTPLPNNHKF